MSDAPPQLGEIPQQSEINVPTLQSNIDRNIASTNGNSSLQSSKDSIYNSEYSASSRDTFDVLNFTADAQSALSSVQQHPATQSAKNTISNGPVAETVKDQHAKTTSEFRNLAGSRAPPSNPAATGQPLTHYHSFFYNLLSWENPRATALSYLSVILFIFGARYLPALRWSFKVLYLTLGSTLAAEIVGKLVFSQGLATSFRPRKYYTIPREALEASLEDVEQLINFFVIEFQRVIFVENLVTSIGAFTAAVLSYWLIKFLPLWGLSLIGVSVIYLGPLIYKSNKEVIDHQLEHASHVVNSQASQVRDIAGHHANRATSTVKAYAGDYTSKAQNYIGNARGRSNSPELSKPSRNPIKSEPGSVPNYQPSDFPHAPKQELTSGVTSHQEQYEKSQFGGQAEPSY